MEQMFVAICLKNYGSYSSYGLGGGRGVVGVYGMIDILADFDFAGSKSLCLISCFHFFSCQQGLCINCFCNGNE